MTVHSTQATRSVLLAFAGLIAGIVAMGGWADALLGGVGLAGVLLLSGVRPAAVVVRLRPFLQFGLVILFFGGFGTQDPVVSVGPVSWGFSAIDHSARAALRLVYLGGAAVWLNLAGGTGPLLGLLGGGAESMKRLGVDVTPVVSATAVAIRFLPLVQREAGRLHLAWKARGAVMYRGILGKVRYATGLVVPLLASALRRSENLAEAIEVRTSLSRRAEGISATGQGAFRPGGGLAAAGGGEGTGSKGAYGRRAVALVIVAWMPLLINMINVWSG